MTKLSGSGKRKPAKASTDSASTSKEAARTRLVKHLTSSLTTEQQALWADLEQTDIDLGLLARLLLCDLLQMQTDYASASGAGASKYYGQRREHIELLRKITQTIHETSNTGPSEMTIHLEGLYQSAGTYTPDGKPSTSMTEVDQ